MIDFDPDRTVWAQVYDLLRERIENGTYKERLPIPSIVHLEQELGVARQTVRKVVAKLAEAGYVRTITGKGTFVRPRDDWQPREK